MRTAILNVLRRIVGFFVRRGYRFQVHGEANLPIEGGAVVVANHVSFIDSLLLTAVVPRPMRFVMSHEYFANPLLRPLFRAVRAIPICPGAHDREMKERAFAAISEALRAGEIVCIFPEGRITKHGAMNEFRPGVERIVSESPVPVIPIGIRGQWGSRFSRQGPLGVRAPGRGRAELSICVGAPITPEAMTVQVVESAVAALAVPAVGRANAPAPEVLPALDRPGELIALAS